MQPMLVEMYTSTRLADLERERQHIQTLASVPKSQRLPRWFAFLGIRVVSFGTWMQRVKPTTA